jgi:hypothetical protein
MVGDLYNVMLEERCGVLEDFGCLGDDSATTAKTDVRTAEVREWRIETKSKRECQFRLARGFIPTAIALRYSQTIFRVLGENLDRNRSLSVEAACASVDLQRAVLLGRKDRMK